MRVHTVCNETQRLFHGQWERSFSEAGMEPVTRWMSLPSDGNFEGDGYGDIIRARARHFVDLLESENEPFAVSDVDVVAFGKDLPQFLTASLGLCDIAFARENHRSDEVCCGFFVVKPNRKTRVFWSNVANDLVVENLINDQPVVNKRLYKSGLTWAHLPREVQSNTYRCPVAPRIYHANNTRPREGKTSQQLKLEQLACVGVDVVAVVAHTAEDLGWVDSMHVPVVVVTSNPLITRSNKLAVPNKGREAGKWLRWIISRYPDFPEHVAFLQGKPSDHCPDFVAKINGAAYRGHGFYPLGRLEFGVMDHCDNEHDDAGKKFAEEILGGPSRFGRWVCGAQMVVSRARLLRHDTDYYERVLRCVENDPLGPWAIERRWFEIL